MPSHLDLILRVVAGGALGSLIGLERNLHSRHVVLRTHILVALASASFMVISIYFAYFQNFGVNRLVEVDASRIAASVVTGIGFLAGGVIFKSGATVEGLTTAASLWLATAVGLMSGAGMYWEGAAVSLLGVGTLSLLKKFEDKKEKVLHRKISLTLGDQTNGFTPIMEQLKAHGVRVTGFNYERIMKSHQVEFKFAVHIPVSLGVPAFIEIVEAQSGVREFKVRSAT